MRLQEDQNIDVHGGPSPSMWKDEQLVTRAQRGEQWAVEELLGRYQQKAYAIAYHLCAEDRQEAEDFTQEAFLRAFRNLGKFRGDSSFYTWFYRIVVNVCLDGKRRRRRRQRIFSPWQRTKSQGDPSGRGPENHPDLEDRTDSMNLLSSKQLSEDIRRSLLTLPETQRMVFQLKVVQGMRIREIAQVMGVAEGTVKSHLFRATRFLREALKEWAQP